MLQKNISIFSLRDKIVYLLNYDNTSSRPIHVIMGEVIHAEDLKFFIFAGDAFFKAAISTLKDVPQYVGESQSSTKSPLPPRLWFKKLIFYASTYMYIYDN